MLANDREISKKIQYAVGSGRSLRAVSSLCAIGDDSPVDLEFKTEFFQPNEYQKNLKVDTYLKEELGNNTNLNETEMQSQIDALGVKVPGESNLKETAMESRPEAPFRPMFEEFLTELSFKITREVDRIKAAQVYIDEMNGNETNPNETVMVSHSDAPGVEVLGNNTNLNETEMESSDDLHWSRLDKIPELITKLKKIQGTFDGAAQSDINELTDNIMSY